MGDVGCGAAVPWRSVGVRRPQFNRAALAELEGCDSQPFAARGRSLQRGAATRLSPWSGCLNARTMLVCISLLLVLLRQ